jgi:hypothetical protein
VFLSRDLVLAVAREPEIPFLSPHCWLFLDRQKRGLSMKKLILCVAVALALTSVAAKAAERAGDAALGALSGAVVLGPIGAVAGAVVGYTAGPHIARSWGFHRSSARGGRRMARQDAGAPAADGQPAPRGQAGARNAAPAPTYAGPPAQGFD